MADASSRPRYCIEFARKAHDHWITEFVDLPSVMANGATREEAERRVHPLTLQVIAEWMEERFRTPKMSFCYRVGERLLTGENILFRLRSGGDARQEASRTRPLIPRSGYQRVSPPRRERQRITEDRTEATDTTCFMCGAPPVSRRPCGMPLPGPTSTARPHHLPS